MTFGSWKSCISQIWLANYFWILLKDRNSEVRMSHGPMCIMLNEPTPPRSLDINDWWCRFFPHVTHCHGPQSKDVTLQRNFQIDFTLLSCDLSMGSSEWATLRYLILAAIIIIMDYSTMEYVTSSCGVSARKICTACA